jgi:signal-transduction protein with cAMP-binding, CBS, and nucleotidyltransferase domain
MMVERDCVMTTDERENFVKAFPLFRRLDNVNKHYTPFFQVRRYSKGEPIYLIDEQPHFLYLIAEGEVEFESRVVQQQQLR